MEVYRCSLTLLWVTLVWVAPSRAQQNGFQIFKQEPPRNSHQQIYTPPLLPSASGRQINQFGGVQFSVSTNVKSQATPQTPQSDAFRGSHYQPPISNAFSGLQSGFPSNPSQSNQLLHNQLPSNPFQHQQHFSQNQHFQPPQIGSSHLSSAHPQKAPHPQEVSFQHTSLQQTNPFSMRSFNDQGSRASQVQPPPSASSFSGYRPPLMPPLPSSAQFPSPSSGQQAIYVGGGQHQSHGAIPVPNTSHGMSVSTSFSGNKERQSKVVESIPQVQAIQKAPASEIQFDKGSPAKDKAANPDDEYVVYYYYYYDDDKQANTNLTLNFDDIPNLEAYDKISPKAPLPAARSASNSLDNKFLHLQSQSGVTPSAGVSVSVSVKEDTNSFPISNIYRYGNNEIPKFPVTPNLLDVLKHAMPPSSTTMLPPPLPSTTQTSNSEIQIANDIEDDVYDETTTEEAETTTVETTALPTTTTTTTTEPTTTTTTTTSTPTTTTTTKRPRRGFGGRGRPPKRGPAVKPSRTPTTRATTTSTTTSVPPSSQTTRARSGVSRFNSNRLKRPFGKSRNVESNSEAEPKPKKSTTTSTTSTPPASTVAPASSKRFGSGGFRRTTSTRGSATTARPTSGPTPRGALQSRSRPSNAPVFGRVNRNRSRPSFHRSRKPVEPEEEKEELKETVPPTTRTPEPTTTEVSKEAVPLHEEDYYEDGEKHEPTTTTTTTTTTRAPRRPASGIFRPRTRPSLFNKPRPSRS